MSIVIGTHAEKGGVGKTTNALNLCNSLALAGRKVILVDIDHSQGTATKHALDPEKYPDRFALGKLPSGQEDIFLISQAVDFLKREKKLEEIILEIRPNFWLVPTWGIDRKFTRWTETEMTSGSNSRFMKKLISGLKEIGFDYIIFDLAPSFGNIQEFFYMEANEVITPILADGYALDGYKSVHAKIDLMDISRKEMGLPPIKRNKMTINQFDKRTSSGKQFFDAFSEQDPNLKIIIVPFKENIKRLRAVYKFASESKSTQEVSESYAELALKILGDYENVKY